MNMNRIRALNLLRGAIILAGIGMIILGASRGEAAVVLKKAVRICLECIGVA